MTLGPVRVMGAGVVLMICVEEVMSDPYCMCKCEQVWENQSYVLNNRYIFLLNKITTTLVTLLLDKQNSYR